MDENNPGGGEKKSETNSTSTGTVQSVERALDIIEAIASEKRLMSLKEISSSVGLSPSTTYRLLNTLVLRGFAEQDKSSSKYKLGIRALELGTIALSTMDIRAIVRPYMEQLAQDCRETINLAILDGRNVVYIDQVESPHILVVKMFARIGSRGPAHCTGSGKILLAQSDERSLRKLFSGITLERFTNETITDLDNLLKELEHVRRQGFSVDLGERDDGVRCVAGPIRNQDGRVVAALSASGPALRLTNYYISNELIPMVVNTSEAASMALGYKP